MPHQIYMKDSDPGPPEPFPSELDAADDAAMYSANRASVT